MTAKIICMASAKGGSGKTLLTATFGQFLATLGKKVLLIDADSSTNGLTLFYLKEIRLESELIISYDREPLGLFELENSSQSKEIVKLKNGVHLFPASYSLNDTQNASIPTFMDALLIILKDFNDTYDFIFIDAQAGADHYAQFCMSRKVSNEVIIVSEYDPMSAAGVERLKGILREDLTYDRTWILLNKILPDFVQSFSDFMQVAKYLNPIPWDADVVKAYARRKLALNLTEGNNHTLAVMETLKTLLGENIEAEITTWIKEKGDKLRKPIEEQSSSTKLQLDSLINELEVLERKNERRQFYLKTIPVLLLMYTILGVFYLISSNLSFSQITLIFMGAGIVLWFIYRYISDFPISSSDKFKITRLKKEIRSLEDQYKNLLTLKEAEAEVLIKMNIK